MAQHEATAIVMDSQINTTVNYSAPVTMAVADDLLGIEITHGLVQATCHDVNNATSSPCTMLKIEFENLACSGRANLTQVSFYFTYTLYVVYNIDSN